MTIHCILVQLIKVCKKKTYCITEYHLLDMSKFFFNNRDVVCISQDYAF